MKNIITYILSVLLVAAGIIIGIPFKYVPLALFAFASFLLYQHDERGSVFWLSFYGALFYGIYVFKTILTPFLLALWLAFLTAPIVDFLEKRKFPR